MAAFLSEIPSAQKHMQMCNSHWVRNGEDLTCIALANCLSPEDFSEEALSIRHMAYSAETRGLLRHSTATKMFPGGLCRTTIKRELLYTAEAATKKGIKSRHVGGAW